MLQTIVGGMAAAILLTVAAELLLPEGNLRRYAAPVTGLLVLLAVLNPFLQIDLSLPQLEWETGDTEAVLADAAQLTEVYQQRASGAYQQEVCRQLEALALVVPGVRQATASWQGQGFILQIQANEDVTAQVSRLAQAFCGLRPEDITIEYPAG